MTSDHAVNIAEEFYEKFRRGPECTIRFCKRWGTLFKALILVAASNTSSAGTVVFPRNSQPPPDFVMPAAIGPISRDIAVGMILAARQQDLGGSRSGITCEVQKNVTVIGTPVAGDPNTFQTNVAGIGVRFYFSTKWGGPFVQAPVSETLPPTPDAGMVYFTKAEFVVTGPIGNGVVTTLPSMQIVFSGSCIPSLGRTQRIKPGSVVSARTCSVNTRSVSVLLPTVEIRRLPDVGSTFGDTNFNVTLNCAPQIKVYMTLTDAASPENRSTNLSLSSDSTARGAALQILQKDTLVSYGPDSAAAGTPNQWSVGTSVSGLLDIPLSARYVRIGDLSAGSVKAGATFTMSYQ